MSVLIRSPGEWRKFYRFFFFVSCTHAVAVRCVVCVREEKQVIAVRCRAQLEYHFPRIWLNSSHTVAYNPYARRAYEKSQHAEDFGRIFFLTVPFTLF